MGINTQIRQLEDDLIATLNNSPVPMEVKRLVLEDVLHLTKKRADKIILQEIEEAKQNAEST